MRRCASACSVPVEACVSMRPFTLRQRRLTFRQVTAAGLTLLAYTFDAIPKSALGPFGGVLPTPPGFFSPREVRSTHATRCQVRSWNSLPVVQASAPLQDLSVLPDRSAQPESKQRSLPLRVARSSFAPRRVEIISYNRATDHSSRSATSRQARCPSNLLEPPT